MNYLAYFLERPADLREYLGSFLSYRLLPIILNMSLTGALVILFVLLIRHYLLKKAPKIFSYALWAVVLFRLLCPVSFSADFSLLGFFDPPALRSESGGASVVEYIPSDIVHTEYPRVELPLMPTISESINETLPYGDEQLGADPLEAPMAELTLLVWPVGLLALLIYSAVSYISLRRRLVGAALLRDNIWLADHIGSPFVMGLFRPKIYLPSSLAEWERDYIILHEQHHIRRGDHIVKALSFFALCIHWFNPLVWVAFVLSGKDMEMSCDEAVIRKLGPDIRADYSRSLLSLATGRPIFSGTPLAFGEGDTGDRIKNLAVWKKARPFVIALSLILVIAVILFCAANASGGSWVKTTLTNGPSFEFTLNLEKPISRWTIYEDVYMDGELASSVSRVTHTIPETAGSAQRRFTSTLHPTYGMGELTCTFSGQEETGWTLSLPFYKHGTTGFDQYDGSTHTTQRQTLEADSSFILATFTLDEGDLNNDLGVVIHYRLVTYTGSQAPEEDGPLGALTPVGGEDAPAALEWLDAYREPSLAYPDEEHSLSLEAFPDTTFHWTPDYQVVARKNGTETVLIEGMPIWNVFLCDLNGDEKPEFCATVSIGSGIIDNRVIVYDYANGTHFELADRMNYNYTLTLDDTLHVVKTSFLTGENVAAGQLLLVADGNGGSRLAIGGASEQTVFDLLNVICSSPAHSSNPGDYLAAHPEEYQQLVNGGPETLRRFFSRFLEGGEIGLAGHVMWAACEDIMLDLGEALILDTVFTLTGQDRFDIFYANARELARQYSRTELEQLHPGSALLLEMTGNLDIPAPSSEFALTINGVPLELGAQKGSFPWDTDLKELSHEFWSSDGFDCFSFTCEDGTVLTGLCAEGVADEQGGTLLTLETTDPDWQTPRGAFVSMSLDEFLALYPDAVRRVNVNPGDHSYTYQEDDAPGLNQILFAFEDDILTSISIGNGIDGYLW